MNGLLDVAVPIIWDYLPVDGERRPHVLLGWREPLPGNSEWGWETAGGGKIEDGEAPLEALKRELFEELGVAVEKNLVLDTLRMPGEPFMARCIAGYEPVSVRCRPFYIRAHALGGGVEQLSNDVYKTFRLFEAGRKQLSQAVVSLRHLMDKDWQDAPWHSHRARNEAPGGEWYRLDGVRDVFLNDRGEVVITGTPEHQDDDGPPKHDCDANGCRRDHVLLRLTADTDEPITSVELEEAGVRFAKETP